MTVLGVTRTDLPFAAHSLTPQANVPGLLGTDLQPDLVVAINFKKRWLEIRQPIQRDGRTKKEVLGPIQNGQEPLADARIDKWRLSISSVSP